MKKVIALILVLAMTLTLFVACGGDEDKGAEGGEKIIGLSMNTLTNPFFVDVKDAVVSTAEAAGYKVVVTDAQDDPTTQAKDIEGLIALKPVAIIIDTCDSDAIVPSVQACNEANIPVFTMDRKSNGGDVIAHVGYNAIKSGNMAADYIAEQLGGTGKVVELQGIMGSNVAQDRHTGFSEQIAKYPGIEVVQSEVANFDRATAMTVMESILQAQPEIDAVYAANDEMALGALEAIEAAGRLDEILIIGCDCINDTLDAMKAGKIEASISEPPHGLGVKITETCINYLNGGNVTKEVVLGNMVLEAKDAATYDPHREVEIVESK